MKARTPDGSWQTRALTQLSGGERRRVALALSLGYAALARSRGRMRANLLVLDEVSACLHIYEACVRACRGTNVLCCAVQAERRGWGSWPRDRCSCAAASMRLLH